MDIGRTDRLIATIQRASTELRLLLVEEMTTQDELKRTIGRLKTDLAKAENRLLKLVPRKPDEGRDYRSPPDQDG